MDILETPLSRKDIVKVLNEEIDSYPSLWGYFLPYSVSWYKGSSTVCGHTEGFSFELRNRNSHIFSLRAKGKIVENREGTGSLLHINFNKPRIRDPSDLLFFFLDRYEADKKVIMRFSKNWLKAIKVQKNR